MANPSVTYTFSNGTAADASEVNTNFSDIINSLTDGTKSLSIDAITAAGAATFNGNVTLGNASGDAITVTGTPTFGAAATFNGGISGNVAFDTDTFYVDASNNRIGAGTASPSYFVDFYQTSAKQFYINSFGAFFAKSSGSGHAVYRDSSGADDCFTILSDVNGSSTDTFSLLANGKIKATVTNWSSSGTQDVGIGATTGYAEFQKFSSSKRYKYEIQPLTFDSELIYKLDAKQFRWKNNDQLDFGFIAEEVDAILKPAVIYMSDENGLMLDDNGDPIPEAVKYKQLVCVVIEEMKKLRKEVDDLKAKG